MRALLSALLVLAAALAGCASSDTPAGTLAAGPAGGAVVIENATLPVETFHFNSTLLAGAAQTMVTSVPPKAMLLPFEVRGNATRIVATLSWTGQGGDLDAVVGSPRACYGERALNALDPDEAACWAQHRVAGDGKGGGGWFRNTAGTPAAPDNPSVLVLEGEALAQEDCGERVCEWAALVYAKGAANLQVAYTVEVHYA